MTGASYTPSLFNDALGDPGAVEAAVLKQVAKLRDLGYVEDHHAGLVQLAVMTARDVDMSFGRGAPSGRANLYRVLNEVLEQLPHPEAASTDVLQEVLAAITAPPTAEELAELGLDG